jgi:flagellar basal-body rod protein FlgB
MWRNLIDNRSSALLERSMDASNMRSQLLTQNLANVNTPHYKRLDIDFKSIFEDEMSKDELEMSKTHPRHFTNTAPVLGGIRTDRESRTLSRYDTNNVDVEFEMAQVSENTLFFQSLAASWKSEMSRLKNVIEGR